MAWSCFLLSRQNTLSHPGKSEPGATSSQIQLPHTQPQEPLLPHPCFLSVDSAALPLWLGVATPFNVFNLNIQIFLNLGAPSGHVFDLPQTGGPTVSSLILF